MFQSQIPVGTSGDWSVEKFEVSEQAAAMHNLGCAINPHRPAGREIDPGKYTRLSRHHETIMSDTPAEIRDHTPFVNHASGHVLVGGLGLGVVTQMLMEKGSLLSLTVIEKSSDVYNLVYPFLKATGLNFMLILGDIKEWKPQERLRMLGIDKFDYAWFDIWDTISADNVKDFEKLRRKYARSAHVKKFWCETECKRLKVRR